MKKPIRCSRHAIEQMLLRGATVQEVAGVVETVTPMPARRGKLQARRTFAFGQRSPVNQQVYAFKTVHVIYADEPSEIVVVTVLVYYEN